MDVTTVGVACANVLAEPLPSCPRLLRPQQYTELLASTAHVELPPAATSVAVPANVTCTGSGCVPPAAPSSPNPLLPQHHTVPSSANTQTCLLPEVMRRATRPPGNAAACTGDNAYPFGMVACALEPSWPYVLSPQHHTTSFVAMAHVCASPAAMRPTSEGEDTDTACTRADNGMLNSASTTTQIPQRVRAVVPPDTPTGEV